MAELRFTEAISAQDLDSLIPQRIKDQGFTGQSLVDVAKKYNLNPGVLWVFGWVDSHWGESSVGSTGNIIGISTDSGPLTDITVAESFEIGAEAMNEHLTNVQSFEEFAKIWAPPGALNDYNNTNDQWPGLVIQTYWEKIGPLRPTTQHVTLATYTEAPTTSNINKDWALEQSGVSITTLPAACEECVALTFDTESGAEKTLPGILDILDEENVKATFFILGSWGVKHPDLIQEVYLRGHLLANHGDQHPWFSQLASLSRKADLDQGEKVVVDASGQTPQPWFRLPYGDGLANQSVIEDLESKGYRSIGWSVDTNDWKAESTQEIINEVMMAQSGDIILMHPHGEYTQAALTDVISTLKGKGLKPVRLDLADVSETGTTLAVSDYSSVPVRAAGKYKLTPMVKVAWVFGDIVEWVEVVEKALPQYEKLKTTVQPIVELPSVNTKFWAAVVGLAKTIVTPLNGMSAYLAWMTQPYEVRTSLNSGFFERRSNTPLSPETTQQATVTAGGETATVTTLAAGSTQPVKPWVVSNPFRAVIGYTMTWPEDGNQTEYLHTGVDCGCNLGQDIFAWRDGTVVYVGPLWLRGAGVGRGEHAVVLDHGNGWFSTYSHNQAALVEVGAQVKAGQPIAECGSEGYSSGPHLHFEIRKETTFTGEWQSPWSGGEYVDPEPLVSGEETIPAESVGVAVSELPFVVDQRQAVIDATGWTVSKDATARNGIILHQTNWEEVNGTNLDGVTLAKGFITEKGWDHPGYHFLVSGESAGGGYVKVYWLWDLDSVVYQTGDDHNWTHLAIAFQDQAPWGQATPEQEETIKVLVKALMAQYPTVTVGEIRGHGEVAENNSDNSLYQEPVGIDMEKFRKSLGDGEIAVPVRTVQQQPVPSTTTELAGFAMPRRGLTPDYFINVDAYLIPGAERSYRCNIHEGWDMGGAMNEEVLAVKDGIVIRSDTNFVELTTNQRQEVLERACEAVKTVPNSTEYWKVADPILGRQVRIQHADGSISVYAHLSSVKVREGDNVVQGQAVGAVGNSGTGGDAEHLHYELRIDGGDSYFGKGGTEEEIRQLYRQAFSQ